MQSLGPQFTQSIQSLLDYPSYDEHPCYEINQLDMFQSIAHLNTWDIELETTKRLTERNLVKDMTHDCRSRQLSILCYNDTPFAMYQYRGRGNYENEVVFNQAVYLQFLSDYMNEYVKHQHTIKTANVTDDYTVYNYDFGVFVLQDGGITSICKTKLDTDATPAPPNE